MNGCGIAPVLIIPVALGLVAGCGAKSRASAAEAEIRAFMESYFGSWSEGRMDDYRAHFHESATIWNVSKGGVRATQPLRPFVEAQFLARERARMPPLERMLSMSADPDGEAATVTVAWELVRDGERVRGTDRFVLLRLPGGSPGGSPGGWKILALVFYSEDARG